MTRTQDSLFWIAAYDLHKFMREKHRTDSPYQTSYYSKTPFSYPKIIFWGNRLAYLGPQLTSSAKATRSLTSTLIANGGIPLGVCPEYFTTPLAWKSEPNMGGRHLYNRWFKLFTTHLFSRFPLSSAWFLRGMGEWHWVVF